MPSFSVKLSSECRSLSVVHLSLSACLRSYAMVSAKIEKKIASDVFQHLQALGLRFHLERKTGSVLRSCTRGASSFSEVARNILFQLVPILIQVSIVVTYLFVQYNWVFAVVTIITIVSYFIFTLLTTNWRDQFRRIMIEKDNGTSSYALPSTVLNVSFDS